MSVVVSLNCGWRCKSGNLEGREYGVAWLEGGGQTIEGKGQSVWCLVSTRARALEPPTPPCNFAAVVWSLVLDYVGLLAKVQMVQMLQMLSCRVVGASLADLGGG